MYINIYLTDINKYVCVCNMHEHSKCTYDKMCTVIHDQPLFHPTHSV